jgi:Ca-activated chloride channel family protein
MKRHLLLTALFLAYASLAHGGGLLIPTEPDLQPLAMLNHHVTVSIEDQVAVTKVEQTFRNHTSRKLEATFVFPVPKGASVRDFATWVNGKRVSGELIKADKAKQLYADIVRQTKSPALLDYIGADMLRLQIFPVPPQGDQKVEVSFTAVANKQLDLVEYVYPLKTDRVAASTLEEFRIQLHLKSQQPIGNIYSPTHEVTVRRPSDREAVAQYERKGASLDRDFQLLYATSGQDVGLTALQHRPISSEDGYVMLLVSPRAELAKEQKVPRDIMFVLDTSGSMLHNNKLEQAQHALRHCLQGLSDQDRFGLIQFATSVNHYRSELVPANGEQIKAAGAWVQKLHAGGGTAIHEALVTALAMRSDDKARMFTVVFFTDGQPTIGERDVDRILSDIEKKNTANTRIFSFGVGDDLNAVLLDQLAERTRAVSQYVRPDEKIQVKVANFFDKINKPVLANLKLSLTGGGTSGDVRLVEVYPPRLPDLFHGDQLVVLARYQNAGKASVVLQGNVGYQEKKFTYELGFLPQSSEKPYVEELWARRKVGYLLDQIRIGGQQKELVDEVVTLAKRYGITTPYTSYLIMPDAPVEVAAAGRSGDGRSGRPSAPIALMRGGAGGGGEQESLESFAKRAEGGKGDLGGSRGALQDGFFARAERDAPAAKATPADREAHKRLLAAKELKGTLDTAQANYQRGQYRVNQVSKLGVDLAVCTNGLKCQSQLSANAVRRVGNRNCLEVGGVWIDEAFTAKTPAVSVKAQSDAYFRILERQPQMKEVFQLGNHVLWITPRGTALVVDTTAGKERISDEEIDALFATK